MLHRKSLLLVATLALLALASPAMAASRYQRFEHPALPIGMPLPPEVQKIIHQQLPKGKVKGAWMEQKGFEMEVVVSVPASGPVEMVFHKTATTWQLRGYEYPVATSSLTPKAMAAIQAKYHPSKIMEVEKLFGPTKNFLGYQVTLPPGEEYFILPNGVWITDPW